MPQPSIQPHGVHGPLGGLAQCGAVQLLLQQAGYAFGHPGIAEQAGQTGVLVRRQENFRQWPDRFSVDREHGSHLGLARVIARHEGRRDSGGSGERARVEQAARRPRGRPREDEGMSLPGAADGARCRPGLLACDESARVVQQSGLIDELEHDRPKLGLRSRKVKPGWSADHSRLTSPTGSAATM